MEGDTTEIPQIKEVRSMLETISAIASELKIKPEYLFQKKKREKVPGKRGRPRKAWPEVSDKAFELLYIVMMFREHIDRCLSQSEISKIMDTSVQVINHHVKFLKEIGMISTKNGIKITTTGIQYAIERLEKERKAEGERIKLVKSIGPIFSKEEDCR